MKKGNIYFLFILVLLLTPIMSIAMMCTANAAKSVTGLKQTGDSQTTVDIEWDVTYPYNEDFIIYISNSKNGKYTKVKSASNGNETIYDLKPGHTYYVKVKMVDDNNKVIASSAPIDVVTAPEDFDEHSITQTSATSKTISVKWGKVAGVTAYKFSYSVTSPFSVTEKSTPIITKTVKENKITIPAKKYTRYEYTTLIAYRKASTGYIAYNHAETVSSLYPQLAAVDTDSIYVRWDYNNKKNVRIRWKDNPVNWDKMGVYPDGYKIQIYTIDGKKKLGEYKVQYNAGNGRSGDSYTIFSSKIYKLIKNKGFKVRIRSYLRSYIDGKPICYSTWSSFKTVWPKVKCSLTVSSTKPSAVLKWNKVSNAVGYYVYVNRSYKVRYSSSGSYDRDSGSWKRTRVSAKTTTYRINGLKSSSSTFVAAYVVPIIKLNGKTYIGTYTGYLVWTPYLIP